MAISLKTRLVFFFTRLTRFEFWPYWIFYFPLLFYGLYLATRARSLMYFSTANPGMKYGGVMGESKYKVLSGIPSEFIPDSALIRLPITSEDIINQLKKTGLEFPLIIKPDVGERGKEVELIYSENELRKYISGKSGLYIVQEFVDFREEFGVLYHRMPHEIQGEVTSVVQKEFLTIKGNGMDTLGKLVSSEIRAQSRLDYLAEKFAVSWNTILPKGEKMRLEPIGNHCRGTSFIDANRLLGNKLNAVFDTISLQIDGFYYGRFDLKVPSEEDLLHGKNIKILELNGVSSEVAHIYDPNYSLWQAWRDTAFHMKIIWKIALKNHALGQPYDHLRPFLKDLRLHLKQQGS
jgi:hypothetical protein